MKIVLTTLITLLAVSSVQARVIPDDSISDYCLEVYNQVIDLRNAFDSACKVLTEQEDWRRAKVANAEFLHGETLIINLRWAYSYLNDSKSLSWEQAWAEIRYTLFMLSWVRYQIYENTVGIGNHQAYLRSQDVIKLLQKLITDCTDSVNNELWKADIRESLIKIQERK